MGATPCAPSHCCAGRCAMGSSGRPFNGIVRSHSGVSMKYFLAVILLVSSISATADCGSRTVWRTARDDGTKIGIVVSDTQFARAPKWSPEKGEPPLSISQVVKISSSWAKDNFKRFDSAQIQSISLAEIGCASGERQWYYLVRFFPTIDGKRVYSDGQFSAVLMDGTVIGPTQLKNDF